MNFKELLYRARQGNQEAILEIFEMYRPLLIKNALVEGIFDEDLYQELTAELKGCNSTATFQGLIFLSLQKDFRNLDVEMRARRKNYNII